MMTAGSVYQYLTQLHRKYGEVVHYRIFDKHFVSTYTPEGYKDLIKHFNKPGIRKMTIWVLNPGPAEPGYALPLQTKKIQISWLLWKKPPDLDLHCLSLSM